MKSALLMIFALLVILILFFPVLFANTMRKMYRGESISEYFYITACGIDQLGGSILFTQEDWKVSSWVYHLYRSGNKDAERFMDFINWIFRDPYHCKNSFFKEAKELNFRAEWMQSVNPILKEKK